MKKINNLENLTGNEKLKELELFGAMRGLCFGIFLGVITVIIIGSYYKWQLPWFLLLIALAVYLFYKSCVASRGANKIRGKIKVL